MKDDVTSSTTITNFITTDYLYKEMNAMRFWIKELVMTLRPDVPISQAQNRVFAAQKSIKSDGDELPTVRENVRVHLLKSGTF